MENNKQVDWEQKCREGTKWITMEEADNREHDRKRQLNSIWMPKAEADMREEMRKNMEMAI